MSPDLALYLTFISANYPCLEHIFMVPKVLKPLKFGYIRFSCSSIVSSFRINVCA